MQRETERQAYEETSTLLKMLASFGVQVRCNADTYALAWKPKFSAMPVEWQEDIREHGIALVRLLWPGAGNFTHVRPGWTNGLSAACVSCGAGTALYDPLGQPRHDGCGWLGQPPAMRHVGHQGKALKLRSQGSR